MAIETLREGGLVAVADEFPEVLVRHSRGLQALQSVQLGR